MITGEGHGAARGHHRSSDRRFGVITLGEFLSEPAHDEQAVVDGDTEAHHRHDRLGEEVHRPELRGEPQDAQRTADGEATDDRGQGGCDRAAEHEEQHDRHQRHDGELGALLVGADGAGQFAGQRVEAGQFDVAAVDLLQIGLDSLVVLQDRVVVVALLGDADEGVATVLGLHRGQRCDVRCLQPPDPGLDLVGVVGDHLVEFPGDFLLPGLVGDQLVIGRRQDGDDVAGSVAAVDLVAQQRRLYRLTAFVVETALRDVISETGPVDAAT